MGAESEDRSTIIKMRYVRCCKGAAQLPFQAVSITRYSLFTRYHDQISSLELKIPAHEVNIPFKWKDAFDKGGLFGEKVSLSKFQYLYMYNVGKGKKGTTYICVYLNVNFFLFVKNSGAIPGLRHSLHPVQYSCYANSTRMFHTYFGYG